MVKRTLGLIVLVVLILSALIAGNSFSQVIDTIFKTDLKGIWVNGFDAGSGNFIDSFKVTSTDPVILTAYGGGSSGDIIKTTLKGTALKGFTPAQPIDTFKTASDAECVYLIAHSRDGTQDTILKSELWGTGVKGYGSPVGNAIRSFTTLGPNGNGYVYLCIGATGSIGIEEGRERELVFGLNIAPNPCVGGHTTISYTVGTVGKREERRGKGEERFAPRSGVPTKVGRVTLQIYDLSGRLVSALIDKVQKPGRYSLLWDGVDGKGRKVATGIYFLRLRAGEFVDVKKVSVIK